MDEFIGRSGAPIKLEQDIGGEIRTIVVPQPTKLEERTKNERPPARGTIVGARPLPELGMGARRISEKDRNGLGE